MNGRAKNRAPGAATKSPQRGPRTPANGSRPGATTTKARVSVQPSAARVNESTRRQRQSTRAASKTTNTSSNTSEADESTRRQRQSTRAASKTTNTSSKASEAPRRPGQRHGKRANAYLDGHPQAELLGELVRRAKAVRANAYAPYSRYLVGAAIATKSGRIFEGCNVENASFGATICAERGAIMQMIAAGEREPVACAVVTGDEQGAAPCGICRQVLAEFSKELSIALVGVGSLKGDAGRIVRLRELLPLMFELRH